MKKKVNAVNPRTGQWEEAEVVRATYATKQTGQQGREHVQLLKFSDGQQVETPTWAIDKK